MQMMLTRRIVNLLYVVVAAGTLIVTGAMAEPDAPRSCITDGPTAFPVEVALTSTPSSTVFTYTIATGTLNPDHAVLAMDCLEECPEKGICSETGDPCSTNAECDELDDQDFCELPENCVVAYGSPDNNGTGLNACGGPGDRTTGIGEFQNSLATVTASPKSDTATFFVEVAGQVTCDSGDIAIKDGKQISYCEICAPLTSLDQGPGAFVNTEKIVTLGDGSEDSPFCRFSRTFNSVTGQLLKHEVLENKTGEVPCPGFALTTNAAGVLEAKFAGEGKVDPIKFGQIKILVSKDVNGEVTDPNNFLEFGLGKKSQPGGNEWTNGNGTCVTLDDGFGGVAKECTCQKPLSPGELAFCR
jgi:hypothetical protein